MKIRKISKNKMVMFRATNSLKVAIELVVSRGGYDSQSDLLNKLLKKQFRKHLTREERRELLRNRKRVSNPGT